MKAALKLIFLCLILWTLVECDSVLIKRKSTSKGRNEATKSYLNGIWSRIGKRSLHSAYLNIPSQTYPLILRRPRSINDHLSLNRLVGFYQNNGKNFDDVQTNDVYFLTN